MNWNPQVEGLIRELAARHEVSADAVMVLLRSLARTGGASAQFNHPELGGSGQWLAGGMTQIGDMFNNALRAKVDALCTALAPVAREHQAAPTPRSSQSQSQYQGPGFFSWRDADFGPWWPSELGIPSTTGAQNEIRYAYFPESRRLAIDVAGAVKVFDTLDYQISGVSQQQGSGSTLLFTSQKGTVDVARLPLVSDTLGRASPAEATRATASTPQSGEDVFAKIERLHELKEKGILTEEEFTAKKKELLARA
jgi:Short C-terminal domain